MVTEHEIYNSAHNLPIFMLDSLKKYNCLLSLLGISVSWFWKPASLFHSLSGYLG